MFLKLAYLLSKLPFSSIYLFQEHQISVEAAISRWFLDRNTLLHCLNSFSITTRLSQHGRSRSSIMKHWSSIFAPKRLNYFTLEPNIPPERPRFSHARLKLLQKLWSIGKGLFTMRGAPMRVNKSVLSTLEICRLSRPKSLRNLSSDRLETKYNSCEK